MNENTKSADKQIDENIESNVQITAPKVFQFIDGSTQRLLRRRLKN